MGLRLRGCCVLVLFFGGCALDFEIGQQNGETCFKHEDCVSRRCLHYVCEEVPAPTGAFPADGSSGPDAVARDAAVDGRTDTLDDARSDTRPAVDATVDGGKADGASGDTGDGGKGDTGGKGGADG